MRRLTAVSLIALALILAGCSSTIPPPSAPLTAEPGEERTDVDWSQYPPETQRLIDEAADAGDCDILQDMFDVADNAGFLDQMKYIDEALQAAGCY